jgi:hypothetical protein
MLVAPHAKSIMEATWRYTTMMMDIFQNIPRDLYFEVVVYEALVQRPRLILDYLGARLDLRFPNMIEPIRDGNHKYWEALRG